MTIRTSRRQFLGLTAQVGATVAASLAYARPAEAAQTPLHASLRGPYLDLSTPRDNKLARARMAGDLDIGKQRYGYYSGYVMGVRPGEKLRDLIGFEGFSAARLQEREDGSYAKLLREVGIYFDLESGEPLEEWTNPYTNEVVHPVHVANDPFNQIIRETVPTGPSYGGLRKEKPSTRPYILPWRISGDRITLEAHIHLYYPNALQPDKWPRESAGEMARVTETFATFIDPADLQNEKLTTIKTHGVWGRVTPWLPWMFMGQNPGHCQYSCFMGGGVDLEQVLRRSTLDYVEKHYPQYFEAPTEWVDPSLSSIERYALEQEPAPPLEEGS